MQLHTSLREMQNCITNRTVDADPKIEQTVVCKLLTLFCHAICGGKKYNAFEQLGDFCVVF